MHPNSLLKNQMALGRMRRGTGISGVKMGLVSTVFWIFSVPENNFALDARVFQKTVGAWQPHWAWMTSRRFSHHCLSLVSVVLRTINISRQNDFVPDKVISGVKTLLSDFLPFFSGSLEATWHFCHGLRRSSCVIIHDNRSFAVPRHSNHHPVTILQVLQDGGDACECEASIKVNIVVFIIIYSPCSLHSLTSSLIRPTQPDPSFIFVGELVPMRFKTRPLREPERQVQRKA